MNAGQLAKALLAIPPETIVATYCGAPEYITEIGSVSHCDVGTVLMEYGKPEDAVPYVLLTYNE